MTDRQSSTSSIPMEPFKRPEDVIRLGRRIVEELELRHGVDTLAKWMAHYVAELIRKIEDESEARKRQALEEKCCSVILRLWANRDQLPQGAQPLGRVRDALTALMAMQAESLEFPAMVRRYAEDLKNPWLAFASNGHSADRKISSIALLAGLLECEFGYEKRWLDEVPGALSKNECELIKALDGWMDQRMSVLRSDDEIPVTRLSPEDRTKHLLSMLEKMLQTQTEAFARLKQAIATRASPATQGEHITLAAPDSKAIKDRRQKKTPKRRKK